MDYLHGKPAHWQRLIASSLGLLLLVQISACGTRVKPPEFSEDLVPISGVITFKKKPLAGAAVTFFPTGTDAVRAAYGVTDEMGTYRLMTPISGISTKDSMGAVPGTYRVIISHLKMPDGSQVPADLTTAEAIEKGAKETLSSRYSSQEHSLLKAEIAKETPRSDLNFDL